MGVLHSSNHLKLFNVVCRYQYYEKLLYGVSLKVDMGKFEHDGVGAYIKMALHNYQMNYSHK